jgi:glutathione-specific gamma-glutamylcyclotransferase
MGVPGAVAPSEPADGDLWVFGYGSLMWRPGFEYLARSKATIQGWRRRLCIYSHVYRGTAERPGLVLGLDSGGYCAGVAFHVAARLREPTIRYLRDRELVTAVYREIFVPAKLESGTEVEALAYVAERDHSQYAAPMDRDRLLELVRQGVGRSGRNAEYVLNTHSHLEDMGIRDGELEWLAGELRTN